MLQRCVRRVGVDGRPVPVPVPAAGRVQPLVCDPNAIPGGGLRGVRHGGDGHESEEKEESHKDHYSSLKPGNSHISMRLSFRCIHFAFGTTYNVIHEEKSVGNKHTRRHTCLDDVNFKNEIHVSNLTR